MNVKIWRTGIPSGSHTRISGRIASAGVFFLFNFDDILAEEGSFRWRIGLI